MTLFSRLISAPLRFIRDRRFQLGWTGAGVVLAILALGGLKYTSSDSFCTSCHVHPGADSTWTLSTHYKNESGVVVHCYQCHLPVSYTHLRAHET